MNHKLIASLFWGVACAGGAAVQTTPTPGRVPAPTGPAPVTYTPLNSPTIQAPVWPDEGPRYWAPRPTESGITANDLRTRLYQIADDSMQGRNAASLGNWKTTEYIAAEFARLGLIPAGENGGYFQELQLGSHRYDSSKVQLSVNGRALVAGVDWAPMAPTTTILGQYSARDVPVVFGGRLGDSVALPAAVRGRVVVLLAPAPVAGGAAAGRGGRGGAAGALPTDNRPQDAGAAGVLVVHAALPANAVSQAFASRNMLIPFTTTNVAGAHITAAAATAANLFQQPLAQLAPGAAGGRIAATWSYEYTRPPYPARNVIAIRRGSDPSLAGQYVVVGAHNDHVGMVPAAQRLDHDSIRAYNTVMRPQGANDRPPPPTVAQQQRIDSLIAYARSIRPPRRDTVMNGADDDGSGTVVLLEIAERFAREQAPKRSIIFISHAAEESGLLGSRYWTDRITVPRDSIVAAHNMDMVGNGGVRDVKFGGPAQVQMLGARRLSSEFGDIIDSLNAVRAETMAIDYSWDRTNALNRFCRSDQVNYFRFAIPVTYFSTGYSPDYHMATDEPQYIDYDKSARVGRFVHEIMTTIANRPNRLAVLPVEQRDLSARC